MRTRTNICYGIGVAGMVKLLSSYCSAGKVIVVYSDRARGERLCEELTKCGYNTEMRRFDEPDKGKKGFVIGMGKEGALLSAAESAQGKYALYPDVVTPDIFSAFCGGYAEFLYFDERFSPDCESMAIECYCGLLASFCDGLATYYQDIQLPYEDRALRGVLLTAKKILLGKEDRDNFVKESIRITGSLVDILSERKSGGFFTSDLSVRLGGGLRNRLLSAYFLNRLLILFTKWNFRDMLIPAENSAPEEPPTELYRSDLLLDEAELNVIARKIKRYSAPPDLDKILEAMKYSVAERSLFAEIYERGIPEGLGYGRT